MYDLIGRIKKRSLKPKFDHKVIRPNGPWVPSEQTDVSKTWARARELMRMRATSAHQ